MGELNIKGKMYPDGAWKDVARLTHDTFGQGKILNWAYNSTLDKWVDENQVEWVRKEYAVTFYDGATQMSGSPVSIGNGLTLANAITKGSISKSKEGYTFDGWYAESTFETEVPETTKITAAKTVYAKFTAATNKKKSK